MNENEIPELTEEEKSSLLSRLGKSRFDIDQVGGADHHEPNDSFVQPAIASTVYWLGKSGARIVGFAEVDGSFENRSRKGPCAVVCERDHGFLFWDHVEAETLEGWRRQLAPAPAFDREIVMTDLGREGAAVTRKIRGEATYDVLMSMARPYLMSSDVDFLFEEGNMKKGVIAAGFHEAGRFEIREIGGKEDGTCD